MQHLTPEQKEQIKQDRKKAYQKAKDKRDNDPDFIALKEAQKKRRRQAYQNYKKSVIAEKKAKKKKERSEREEQLLTTLHKACELKPKPKLDV